MTPESDVSADLGHWWFHFVRDSVSIPIRAGIQGDTLFFWNSDETITCSIQSLPSDSFRVDLPVFGTYLSGIKHSSDSLSGHWINPFKSPDYSMPFYAVTNATGSKKSIFPHRKSTYAVRFSPDTEDEYPAVGVFLESGNQITGTFMTETGDYRFLEGEIDGNSFWLSCFDGAHLFLFDAQKNSKDSIIGSFYSGKHWKEPWLGILNPEAKLHHPDSITQIIVAPNHWEFRAYNQNRTELVFNPSITAGKVSIVQIFGSWCPNCMDESRFFKSLYADYGDQGLQVIPVAFELGNDTLKWHTAVQKYSKYLELPYEFYFGGSASKGRASEVFSMLSSVSSFPTTLFIDKKGTIRKVHTGFYGPSTGSYYDNFVQETKEMIETLLNEGN